MKWMEKLNENIKKTVRSWLNVTTANPYNFQINEMMDFEGHAIRNRIVSTTPYARRLYFHPEYHFQTKENPHAKGKWYEDWIPPNGPASDFAPEAFKKFYKRLTKV